MKELLYYICLESAQQWASSMDRIAIFLSSAERALADNGHKCNVTTINRVSAIIIIVRI